tara:strand:+ start:3222 stop:3737 length:516 start_codon:yes stop_codon:yes gene_type:complete
MHKNIIPHSELNSLIRNIIRNYPSIYQEDLYQSCYLETLERQTKSTSKIPAQWVTYLKKRLKGVCDDFIREDNNRMNDSVLPLNECTSHQDEDSLELIETLPLGEDTDLIFTNADTLLNLKKQISQRDWKIIELKAVEGYNNREISEMLGLCRQQVWRILEKIKNTPYDSI